MDTRRSYIDFVIDAIQALHIKSPKNGLENWLVTIEGELTGIHARQLNMTTIMHQFGLAFYTGIVEGSMHEDERYQVIFKLLTVDDIFMKTIFDAMTAHGNASASDLVFTFPKHTCTDDTLQNLAHAMRNQRFPRNVVLDFSATKGQDFESRKFSNAGIDALLEVLRDETCMVSANIYFNNAHGFIHPEKLQELDSKLTQCRQRYEDAHKKPVKRIGHKKEAGHKKLVNEAEDKPVHKAAKPKNKKALGGIFAKLAKKKADKADAEEKKEKKKDNRHSPRGHK